MDVERPSLRVRIRVLPHQEIPSNSIVVIRYQHHRNVHIEWFIIDIIVLNFTDNRLNNNIRNIDSK